MTIGAGATDDERLAAFAARELHDSDVCFVGVGIPSDAAVLAKSTHAPGLTLVYESGVVDAIPETRPLSTGSPSVASGSAMIGDGLTAFGALQAGRLDVAVLSGAQVDRQANLNSTVIGAYEKPRLRLVGSGGAHDIASLIERLIIVMPHDVKRFVQSVDFVTSPGMVAGGPSESRPGPLVITPHARFELVSGELMLTAIREGISPDWVARQLPWRVAEADELSTMPEPDAATLAVLRRFAERSQYP